MEKAKTSGKTSSIRHDDYDDYDDYHRSFNHLQRHT